ncbi:isopentenyl phosphate kinase family protein [Candidatus Micrarchaeota archaeon]|nr:isopentenyl phosphate kinase family protein [Candidatus Micrarchaeota archaeon]
MENLVVLKLGGSVVTVKEGDMQARKGTIKKLAKAIAEAKKENPALTLVVVNGAGCFGHAVVKKHGIKDGVKTVEQKIAFGDTHWCVNALNQLIVRALLDAGVPAIGLPPSSLLDQDNKRIAHFDLAKTRQFLEFGMVPVLYGDFVLDSAQGGSVVSGDQLVTYIARELKAERMVFASDVDGVCDSDPKTNPNAVCVKLVSEKNKDEVLAKLEGAKTTDVTGGMKGKITELLEEARITPIFIVNGNRAKRVQKALLGKKVTGTLVKI